MNPVRVKLLLSSSSLFLKYFYNIVKKFIRAYVSPEKKDDKLSVEVELNACLRRSSIAFSMVLQPGLKMDMLPQSRCRL